MIDERPADLTAEERWALAIKTVGVLMMKNGYTSVTITRRGTEIKVRCKPKAGKPLAPVLNPPAAGKPSTLNCEPPTENR